MKEQAYGVRDSNIRLPSRVAYVTQWFLPEPTGPAVWIAQSLQNLGMTVRVITGVPNYPRGVVYPGYSAFRSQSETIGGVQSIRCPVYPSHDGSALRRATNYLTFALSASWTGRKILRSADVVLVYSSPETAAIPALLAHFGKGKPYVLVVQDLWPESALQTGFINSRLAKSSAKWALESLDSTVCRNASHIVVIAPGMKDALVARGVAQEKITVIFNWVDESIVFPRSRTGALRDQLGIPDQDLLFTFAGNHGAAQGLTAWIKAIAAVRDLKDLHFAFIGNGAEKPMLEKMALSLGLERTHFLNYMPIEQYVELVADSDAQLISLTDVPLFRITIPGKVQSNLALGRAIIASVSGDPADVIRNSGGGFVAAPGNISEIEEAIRLAHAEGQSALLSRGKASRKFYQEHMSQEKGSTSLRNVLKSVLAAGSAGRVS